MRMATLVAVLVVVMASTVGVAQTGGVLLLDKDANSEQDRFFRVLDAKSQTWRQEMPTGKEWPTDDNPWAPFDLARMFRESDLVVVCRFTGCMYRMKDGVLRMPELVESIRQINAVHKGAVAVDTRGQGTGQELKLNIMTDVEHTGHEGCLHLDIAGPSLLFLQNVHKEEREQRGYTNVPGVFYKVNRVWHGAICLAGGIENGLPADANAMRPRSTRYRIRYFWKDVHAAVQEMAADERETPGAARLASHAFRAKLYAALARSAASGKPDEADAALRELPAEIAAGYEGVAAYRAIAAEKDALRREVLIAHVETLATLAKNVSDFASHRREASTRPAATQPAASQPAKGVTK